MQTYLLAAAVIAVVVGIVHSALGEFLIFRKLRSVGLVPTEPASPLQSRHIRILWATWHLASVFGFALAAILFALSNSAAPQSFSISRIARVTAGCDKNTASAARMALPCIATAARQRSGVSRSAMGGNSRQNLVESFMGRCLLYNKNA